MNALPTLADVRAELERRAADSPERLGRVLAVLVDADALVDVEPGEQLYDVRTLLEQAGCPTTREALRAAGPDPFANAFTNPGAAAPNTQERAAP